MSLNEDNPKSANDNMGSREQHELSFKYGDGGVQIGAKGKPTVLGVLALAALALGALVFLNA